MFDVQPHPIPHGKVEYDISVGPLVATIFRKVNVTPIEQALYGPTQRIRSKEQSLSSSEQVFINLSDLLFSWNHGGIFGPFDQFSETELDSMVSALENLGDHVNASVIQDVRRLWYGTTAIPDSIDQRQDYKYSIDEVVVDKIEEAATFEYAKFVSSLILYAQKNSL